MDEQFELWLEAYAQQRGWDKPSEVFTEDEHDNFYDAFRAGWEYRRLLEQ